MARRHFIAAGMLAAACLGQAWGQTRGEATLSSLDYSLFDLDLTDSAAPSIRFSVPDGTPSGLIRGYAEASIFETGPRRWEFDRREVFDDGPGMARSASVIGPLGHARAEGTPGPDGSPLGQTLSASWSSQGSGDYGGASVVARAETSPVLFTLAPRTRVTFTALLAVQGSIDLDTIRFEQFGISGYLGVFNLFEPYSDFNSTETYRMLVTLPDSPLSMDETHLLSVSWDNPGDQPVYGAAHLNLWGNSYTASLLPVPEPAPLAMLLAGGLLLLLRARHGGAARQPVRFSA